MDSDFKGFLVFLFVVFVAVIVAGSIGSCHRTPMGNVLQRCYPNATCDKGLTCHVDYVERGRSVCLKD